MSAERLLSVLKKVRQHGHNRWAACCPAHDDHSPSLSVRVLDDGRVLVHCFAGCGVDAVMGALGLSTSDLFPERITDHAKPVRPNHFHLMLSAFRAIAFEAHVVAVAAETLAAGITLPVTDRDRLIAAAGRIREALRCLL